MLLKDEAQKNSMIRKKRRSRAKVRRLRFHAPDGKPYQRPETVENQIADMLPLHHSERAAQAPVASSEALIYFIRRADSKEGAYYDALVEEIDTRLVNQAGRYVRGLPQVTGEDIVMRVQDEFRKLILAERSSARSEFLEVSFALAVKRRTLQLVNLYRSSPWSRRANAAAEADDEELTERQLQQIPDGRPDPERALLEQEQQDIRKELCEKALGAITDPLDREIATLHWLEGWPIQSKFPDEDDLVTRYGTTKRRIDRRLERSKKQMRSALGVGVTQ
jgi:hypothetical protein